MIQTAAIQFTLEILVVVVGIDELKGALGTLGTLASDPLKDDTQVYKEFVQNDSFKRFVGDMVYAMTNP